MVELVADWFIHNKELTNHYLFDIVNQTVVKTQILISFYFTKCFHQSQQ